MGVLRVSISVLTATLLGFTPFLQAADVDAPDAAEIVRHCDLETYPGKDQQSKLTVTLRDSSGTEKKSVYRRLWKDYKGDDQLLEKMVVITDFPPDQKGTTFMHWLYLPSSGKPADQWLYLPFLRKIQRVSDRNPGDMFLGSDLTLADISYRPVDADEHRLLRVDEEGDTPHYVVESIPKESNALYGKRVTWYKKADDWKDCLKTQVEYYDTGMHMLKTEKLTWQKVKDAWVWDTVTVENVQTGHSSTIQVSDVGVDVGLKDSMFTERRMKRGF